MHAYDRLPNYVKLKCNAIPTIFPENNDRLIDYSTEIRLVANPDKNKVVEGSNFKLVNLSATKTVSPGINAQNFYINEQDVPANKKLVIISKLKKQETCPPKRNQFRVSPLATNQISTPSSPGTVLIKMPIIQGYKSIGNVCNDAIEVPSKKQRHSSEFQEEMAYDPLEGTSVIISEQNLDGHLPISTENDDFVDLTNVEHTIGSPGMEQPLSSSNAFDITEIPVNIIQKKVIEYKDNEYPNITVIRKDLRGSIMHNPRIRNPENVVETVDKENPNVIIVHNKKPLEQFGNVERRPIIYRKSEYKFPEHIEEEVNRTVKDPLARKCIKIIKQNIEGKDEKLQELQPKLDEISKRLEDLKMEKQKLDLERSLELNVSIKKNILFKSLLLISILYFLGS